MPDHPTPEELTGFLLGTLPLEKSDDLARHLEVCMPCLETVHDLEAHADSLLESLRGSKELVPIDAACRQGMQKAISLVKGAAADADSATESVSGRSEEIDTAEFAARSDASPNAVLPSVHAATPDVNFADSLPALTVEQFVARLKSAEIVADEDWPSLDAEIKAASDGEDLGNRLVARDTLTSFQAQFIARGKTRGLVLGEYILLDRIGAGGMGQVYKARHRRMDRLVALKVISPAAIKDAEAVKRFQREVKTAARLIHPNIVTAFDAGQQGDVHFLVMELVEGADLSRELLRRGPLSVQEVIGVILQAARGLAFAHAAGVVHRDIKPANLLIDKHGVVRILDMGLARFDDPLGRGQDDGLTHSGQVMGTVDYMAPEQAFSTRDAGQAADVYSLGCTLYRLLTARAIYGGATVVQKILAHREQPIPALVAARPEVSATLEMLYERMVAKKAEARPSMTEIVAELERLEKVVPSPGGSRGKKPPLKRILVGASGFLFLVLGIWVIVRDKNNNEVGRMKIPDEGSATIHTTEERLTTVVRPSLQPTAALPNDAPSIAIAPFDAAQARKHQEAWAKHLGTEVETVNSVGMKMILIPPGEFLMGSSDEQVAAALKLAEDTNADSLTRQLIQTGERPPHRVIITNPFRLGQMEVTIGQFRKFVDASEYRTEAEQYGFSDSSLTVPDDRVPDISRKRNWRSVAGPTKDESPVGQITWNDAVAYCRWLSAQERTTYRLPTEAEWEYSCRAGTTTQFHFGDDLNLLEQDGTEAIGRPAATTLINSKLPNPFGLHDMHGGHYEWCQDFYAANWYVQSPSRDPAGPTDTSSTTLPAVLRGGGKGHHSLVGRSAHRHPSSRSSRFINTGFRVVRDLVTTATVTASPMVVSPLSPLGTPPAAKTGRLPGPRLNVLPGLISRPAALPKVRRWNIETVAPRAGIDCLAWSPDGKHLAAASQDGSLRVYRVGDDGTLALDRRFTYAPGKYVRTLIWHPDGSRFAYATGDGKSFQCLVRDAATGKELLALPDITVVGGWTRDGRRFLAANERFEIVVWKVPEWTVERTLTGAQGHVRGLAWSADERQLAACCDDKTCRVWKADGDEVAKIDLPASPVAGHQGALSWRQDGRRLVVSLSGTYVICDLDRPGNPRAEKTSSPANNCAFRPGTDELAVARGNYSLFLDDSEAGPTTRPLEGVEFGSQPCAAWSPDGKWIAVGDDRARLYVCDGGKRSVAHAFQNWNFHAPFWYDGGAKFLAMSPHTIRTWSNDGEQLGTAVLQGANKNFYPKAFSRDGRRVAFLANNRGNDALQIYVLDVLAGDTRRVSVSDATLGASAFSPDGKLLAVLLTGNRLQLFDVATWRSLWDRTLPGEKVHKALIWSSDSGTIWAVGDGGMVGLSPSDPGRQVRFDDPRLVPTNENDVTAATAADQALVHGSQSNRTLSLVDLRTRAVIWSHPWPAGLPALSCDGTMLMFAEGDHVAKCHAAPNKNILRRPNDFAAANFAWSPDDGVVLEAGNRGTIRIIDAETLEPRRTIVHLDERRTATFSESGDLLFPEPYVDRALVYIVEDDDGATTLLLPAEFRKRFPAK